MAYGNSLLPFILASSCFFKRIKQALTRVNETSHFLTHDFFLTRTLMLRSKDNCDSNKTPNIFIIECRPDLHIPTVGKSIFRSRFLKLTVGGGAEIDFYLLCLTEPTCPVNNYSMVMFTFNNLFNLFYIQCMRSRSHFTATCGPPARPWLCPLFS